VDLLRESSSSPPGPDPALPAAAGAGSRPGSTDGSGRRGPPSARGGAGGPTAERESSTRPGPRRCPGHGAGPGPVVSLATYSQLGGLVRPVCEAETTAR